MILRTGWCDRVAGSDCGRLPRNPLVQRMAGGTALVCVSLAAAWILTVGPHGRDLRNGLEERFESAADRFEAAEPKLRAAATGEYAKLAAALKVHAEKVYQRRFAAARGYDPLFDTQHLLGLPAARFVAFALQETAYDPSEPADDASAEPATTQALAPAQGQPANQKTAAATSSRGNPSTKPAAVAAAPVAASAPAKAAITVDVARARATVAASLANEKPTIFEKLFGKPKPVSLAYAAPDDAGLGGAQQDTGRYDRDTAVYDISAHTVYMPDGTMLEAHSGRLNGMDDPRHTPERGIGPTPVNVYNLSLRESLFHGVQALRLNPVDESKVFGRSGFLAHTYMLGPQGASFGCVSFKDYNAFLRAYLNKEIKRLVVVASLS